MAGNFKTKGPDATLIVQAPLANINWGTCKKGFKTMRNGFVKLSLAVAAIAVLSAQGAVAATSSAVPGNVAPSKQLVLVAADSASEGAKNFISSMGDRGINFLGDANMSQSAKTAEFRQLLNESFDMNTIARFFARRFMERYDGCPATRVSETLQQYDREGLLTALLGL